MLRDLGVDPAGSADSLEGSVLAGYRVAHRHAEGGMGTVYRAVEIATGRDVALKVLRSSGARRRGLERERAALARLADARVVRYLGEGRTPDGRPFLAFDWLEGEDLQSRLGRGRLDVGETVRLAIDVATGLGAAHSAGIVHRDVKPANVMIAPDGRATLLDFGIAQAAGRERPSTLGTALYLAPELIGRRRVVDARADVYALGCVMFECLTGAAPFAADGVAQTLLRGMLETAPRLSLLRPEVPAWIDRLVASMLSKQPDERPRDGSTVAVLLDRGETGAVASSAVGRPSATQSGSYAFALLRVGGGGTDETTDLEHESERIAPVVVSTCREFGISLDSPLADVLLMTALDADPRDQLRRLLGASVRMVGRVPDVRIAVVTGGADAIERGRALLERAPPGAAYADDDSRRLAPAGSASFVAVGRPPGEPLLRLEPAVAPVASSLVGRDAVIARLGAALTAREPAFAILLGDGGIGKTAVVDQLRRAWGDVPGSSFGGRIHLAAAPYHGLYEWVRSFVAPTGELDEATLRAELGRRLGRRAAMRSAQLARLLALPTADRPGEGPGPQGSREALEVAVVDCMCAVLAGAPLFVDDAQWLDADSVATLLRLLARQGRPPVLLAARPELAARFPELVARATTVERLLPLDAGASAALLARVLPALDPTSAASVVRDAEGHPLVLLELGRAIAADGDGRPPATAVGLVQSRLRRLGAAAREVLAVSSVLGGVVSRDRLAVFASGAVDAPIAELVASGVLVAAPTDPTALHFATALVEEAAYGLLDEAERVALHTAVARELGSAAGTEPALLLHHAERSGDAALVTLAHVIGAEHAALRFDFDAALSCARAGVSSGADDEQLGRLRLCEAEALLMAERYAEAEFRAREAAELLRAGSLGWVRSVWVRSKATNRRLDPAGAMAIFDELVACEVDDGEARVLELRTLLVIAATLILIGLADEGEARSAVVERMASATTLTDGLEADLGLLRARRAHARGEWCRYLEELERAERLQERSGDLPSAVLGRINRAHGLFELGAYADAIELGRTAVAEAEELELGYALGYGRFLLGVFLRRAGEPVAARVELARALDGSDEDPRLTGEVALELALDALDRGDLVEAEREVERSLALLERSPANLSPACAVSSMVRLRRGDVEGALSWAERARSTAAPLGAMVEDLSIVRLALLEACAASGDPRGAELAREAMTELDDRAERVGGGELTGLFRARPDNRLLCEAARALGWDDRDRS